MRKVVLTYGVIAGVIVGALMLLTLPLVNRGVIDWDNGMVVGYTTMVIALSLIFFAVRSYRDNYAKGVVSFWKACQIGLLITLVAGVIYALAWEILYSNISEEFTKKMNDSYIERLEAKGLSDVELAKEMESQAWWMDMYKIFIVRFAITIMEVLPVGVIITLISATLLRRKEFLPSETTAS